MIYLHVGGNKSIRTKDIIGIFDSDSATISGITRKYLSKAEKNGETETVNYEIPKSFVVYSTKDCKNKVCFSQFSSTSLVGRVEES